MKLGTEVGLSLGLIVLDGDQTPPPPKRGHISPHFSAHVYCSETAGWIKMPFGTEVGLCQGDIVFDRDSAALQRNRGHSPQFSTRLLSPNCRPSQQLMTDEALFMNSFLENTILDNAVIGQIRWRHPLGHELEVALLEKTRPGQCGDVVGHTQLTVDKNAEVRHRR